MAFAALTGILIGKRRAVPIAHLPSFLPLRLLIPLLCVLALGLALAPPQLLAQTGGDQPIFRRFSSPPRRSVTRLRMLEVPVALRPQTDPDAKVHENVGLGYLVGFQPFNRVFTTGAVTFGRMSWTPSDPAVASAKATQLDASQGINFWLGSVFSLGFELGLGVLDSLVVNTDGTFEHNLVPYIPVRLGLMAALGDRVFLGLRLATTPFFGEGHVTGQSRLLFGIGWTL